MKQTSGPTKKAPAETVIKNIRRATRRQFTAEEKIRIGLEGLRGEESIAELCRREGIANSMYYGWSKEFLEAGKRRLAGDTAQAATSDEVRELRREASTLKEVVADLTLENRLVEQSHLPVRRTLEKLGIPRATFNRRVELHQTGGPEALEDRPSRPGRVWNRIPDEVRAKVIALALEPPELSPRELAVRFADEERDFVSEVSAYRLLKAHDLITSPAYIVLKAADEFTTKTTAPNQLWQTDFTYLKVTGWGWYHLSTVLDDLSRFVVAWTPCSTMQASDIIETLDLALAASGLDPVKVRHRPRLLSDNGSSCIAGDLAEWLEDRGMTHIRGAPRHPQTQGKIERWHPTLRNRILLEHHYLPGALEEQVGAVVEHHNHARAHESLKNLTPADVHLGRGEAILAERELIKKQTLTHRRLQHHARAA